MSAAQKVYHQSGLGPQDFQVIELHDCFGQRTAAVRGAWIVRRGEAPTLIDAGDTTYGGRWWSTLRRADSAGHPLGLPVGHSSELTWQLRGTAGKRQVDNVDAAPQHNIGLGGAAVVTAYRRAER